MTQQEKASSCEIVKRPVKQAAEQPDFTQPIHQSQGSLFGPITNGAARRELSEWRVAHEEAKRWAELNLSRNLKAWRQAKKVLRSGGFLLHVDPRTSAERLISIEEAFGGVTFLSVWIRSGMEITLTRNQGAHGTPISVPPPGRGWRFHHLDLIAHSTEWHRAHGKGDR
ncbi:hypothetical protein [Bradyrhizobium sp. CCBAU 51765]|uniref:hypothetical protein n=1 Tax=Bradyrhizobium sp. CCBAU 51765 TaxID=1325102 RepID=UPI0018880E70|nr:hypothetical protein [Bradyrhizobium sp. CCBAU 51765]QOZ06645.1 hypothetical protein XH96_03265 [Bradyrhizobium sp. CCBAU 51765]